jgi:hypothetical protein
MKSKTHHPCSWLAFTDPSKCRFSAMGKDCKHEADAVFRISPQADPKDHKRALVVAVDSTLCFILAFVLSDRCRALEKRMPPSEMWRTFIPLSLFVSDKAKNSSAPGLHGFWWVTLF